ncbi:MAG TPA: hypothetical protein H9850_10650 [Candidatus Anaerobiospirillum pullistercoris]|uniref:Uncharacterized protein n=1 Tax=Candidatus Anaerobiospirillum pullistercoris TaxID=2838452 RepID=A0A9D2B2C0_9GAMM|nr:hypothetical protein [Candidatus Anaerobiospirillum pullistercoris]
MQLKLRIDAANSLKANASTVAGSQKAAGAGCSASGIARQVVAFRQRALKSSLSAVSAASCIHLW